MLYVKEQVNCHVLRQIKGKPCHVIGQITVSSRLLCSVKLRGVRLTAKV